MEDAEKNPESPASRVISFLSKELAVPRERIEMLTRLRQDLNLGGVDAANLIEAYALTFDVNIDALRVNDYFAPEGAQRGQGHVWFMWVLWLFGNAKPLKTLTVKDLVLALDKGRLP